MEKNSTVLAIEDDEIILRFIEAILVAESFKVLLARSGKEGLETFDTRHPDIVLLDMMLPDTDGYDVLTRIRERSNTPVIMLTAVKTVTSTSKSLELGANDYVTKPFRSHELVARINAKLRRAA